MQVADPLGGSFYLEALTSQMEAAAEEVIREVEQMGGMTEAIISGKRVGRMGGWAHAGFGAGLGAGFVAGRCWQLGWCWAHCWRGVGLVAGSCGLLGDMLACPGLQACPS